MALSVSLSADQQTLTVVSDKRVTPEVRETFKITVEAGGETKVYDGDRQVSPRSVAGVSVSDSRSGVTWTKVSDDDVTAVYRRG